MKILLLRFSSIGDIVLTTPIIRCLHEQLPNVQIHYLTRSNYLPLLYPNPRIFRLWYFEKSVTEVVDALRQENFEYIVDLHCNWRSYRLRLALHRPSVGFPKLNIKKWILVNTKLNLMPDIHLVDRYFKAVNPLGVINDRRGAEILISVSEKLDPRELPESFKNGFIAMAIGGKHFTKQIPESLAINLIQRLPLPVMLLGGPEDAAKAENIVKQTKNQVYNACGRFILMQSASALNMAQLVITGDTGLMHISAALQKKMIVVWGNTVPAFGMGPYLPGYSEKLVWHSQVNDLPCRPCSKLGFTKCPKGHFKCMLNHSVEKIVEKANEILNNSN